MMFTKTGKGQCLFLHELVESLLKGICNELVYHTRNKHHGYNLKKSISTFLLQLQRDHN